MRHATTTADAFASCPLPPPDRDTLRVPERIDAVLAVVAVLIEYGRHLLQTMPQRAAGRGFATIAQYFGTASVPVITAHIQRGMMRALALQRMLLQRARSGCDLRILAPRRPALPAAKPTVPPTAPTTASATGPLPAAAAPPRSAAPHPASGRAPQPPLTSATLPSMAQIEAEVRRRTAGQNLVDICRDLGIAPALCTGPFWNRIFAVIHGYRGSFNNIMLEMRRREKRFARAGSKCPQLALPEQTRDGLRRVLGFFIGEQPAVPPSPAPPHAAPAGKTAFDPTMATATTGPP